MSYVEILGRGALFFVTLLVLARILGKKQVGQLTYFNYIAGITFGSITATSILNPNISIVQGLFILGLWTGFTLISSMIALKSETARHVIDGTPRVIIRNGKVLDEALRKERLDTQQLMMMIRSKNVFSIADVDYAIIEPNGDISVLQKIQNQQATKQDVQANTVQAMYFPTQVIIDGKVKSNNLQKLNLDQEWLEQQLKMNGINNPKEVFLAEVKADGTLYIDKYNDMLH